jgi:uncharacterized damage-inducible protein DinB
MIDLPEIIRQLASQGEAIRVLAQVFTEEQAAWKPDADTWSLKDVMQHMYNEERLDFRRHLKGMFGEPQPPDQRLAVETARQGLEGLLAERQASIAWLSALRSPDWDITKELRFGPNDTLTISAGEMLLSWVEHDILHLRQIVELMHACNERQASPNSVMYAGGW